MTDADTDRPEWVDRAGTRLGQGIRENGFEWVILTIVVGLSVQVAAALNGLHAVPGSLSGVAEQPAKDPVEIVIVQLWIVTTLLIGDFVATHMDGSGGDD